LHIAAGRASLEVVQYLVEENALAMLGSCRKVALHKACRACKFDVIEYLMNKNMTAVSNSQELHE
jgi:hypothetical protein